MTRVAIGVDEAGVVLAALLRITEDSERAVDRLDPLLRLFAIGRIEIGMEFLGGLRYAFRISSSSDADRGTPSSL